MPTWIEQQLTSATFLWTLQRRDGATIGFTTHDRDLHIDGLTYRSAPGMLPSAIERSDGFDADNVELSGALTSNAIDEAGLLAGRWDGASLRLELANWENPTGPRIFLTRGELGSVETSDGAFTVTLRGPTSVLDAPLSIDTTPDCRAALGDRKCWVDLAQHRRFVRVISATSATVTIDWAAPEGNLAFGSLRWFEGANSGLESRILASTGATLSLDEPPAFVVEPDVLVEVTSGCDKRFATCAARFANTINFRGEPHLPGNDLLTRYAA